MRQDMGIGRRIFLRRAVSMAALTVAPVYGKVMASTGGVSLDEDFASPGLWKGYGVGRWRLFERGFC